MANEVVIYNPKEARSRLKERQIQSDAEVVKAILDNPFVWIILGVITLEWAERHGLTGNIVTTAAETGIITAASCRALAPALPAIGEAAGDLIKALGPIAAGLAL